MFKNHKSVHFSGQRAEVGYRQQIKKSQQVFYRHPIKTLFFTSWFHTEDSKRQEEFLRCISNTLSNPKIDFVYLLAETEFPFLHPKLTVVPVKSRPTYKDFFTFANTTCNPGSIIIISNTDIYPGEDIQLRSLKQDECWALSRWDVTPAGPVHFDQDNSQDVWIFRSPIRPIAGEFHLGEPGCDGKIAANIKHSGYTLLNPSKTVKFYHLHDASPRIYTVKDHKLKGPTLKIKSTGLPHQNIVITSIAPKHTNSQQESVKSWINHDLKVYSINTPTECESLQGEYPEVEFIPLESTVQEQFGKPLTTINSIIEFAKQKQFPSILILNSDMILRDPGNSLKRIFKNSESCISALNRWDFKESIEEHVKIYAHGFDGFVIHSKFYGIFPQSIYSLGQTWWDYWVPYTAIKHNIPIVQIKEQLLFHKLHGIQYSHEQWDMMTKYFQKEYNYMPQEKTANVITGNIFNIIQHEFRKNTRYSY